MQGAFARMMDAVHRYEGTVAQFLGDGSLALFGAPIAHEDSARRAVAAALHMQQALSAAGPSTSPDHPSAIDFRIGLNTGPVIVGKIGDDLSMDYTAIGDTANLAARMQQLAEPGTVYLSEQTYRAVRDYVECARLGALAVKGKAEPVVAYRAVREKGVRTRFEVASQHGLTRHIGRDHELRVLWGYGEQARRGQGQVVFISGEAGIGKSRLLLEFRRLTQEENVTWLEGHCISYGQSISYLPIIDIVKQALGVQEGDLEAAILAHADRATVTWDPAARATVPYLKYLLSVDPGDPVVVAMDALQRRAGIFDSLRALFIQESRRHPLVIVVEDLHWLDEKSGEALAALVDLIATLPVLLVLTYRPGYTPALGERTYYNRLALGHLPSRESVALAEAMLEVTALPPSVQRLVAEQAEGNPLYIEEVLKALVERGDLWWSESTYVPVRPLEQVHVPTTIQEIILSRIDHLQRQAREALQLGAVIGREFTVRLLARISDQGAALEGALGELNALELIYARTYFPELAYMFKHALTQDVAYSTLLLERRKALHRVVAAAIEELYADRLAEQYETLAHHYTQGEVWDKALDYVLKAAHKAAAAFANADALAYYDQALAVGERLGATPMETLMSIYESKAAVCLTVNDWRGVVDNYTLLKDLARAAGARRAEGIALSGIAGGRVWTHEFGLAEMAAHEALAMAGDLSDNTIRGGGTFVLAQLDALRGNLASAEDRLIETIRLCRQTGQQAQAVYGAELLAFCHSWRGHYDEAHRVGAGAIAAARQYHVTTPLLAAMWSDGLALAGQGQYDVAVSVLRDVDALAERMGNKAYQSRALNSLGWIHGELCDWQQANAFNRNGLELARSVGNPEITVNVQINLADCAAASGNREQARRELEALHAALRDLHEWMKWRYAQRVLHSLGEIVLATGDTERALALADECLALAEPTQSRKNIVKGRRLRGQALMAQGKPADAEGEIAIALEIAQEIGNPPQIWQTLVAHADVYQAQARPADARQAYGAALATITTVAAGLQDERLRRTFLSSSHVLRIAELAP
jgi:tetratricopeptide (TPR) repeat protein